MKIDNTSAALALMALAAGGAFATEAVAQAPVLFDRNNVELQVGYMTDLNDGLTVESLYGGSFGISYTYNRTPQSSHNLGFSLGAFYGSETIFSDDILSQKCSQHIIPLMAEYKYTYNVAENWGVYVGARAGAYISKTQSKYNWADGGCYKYPHTRVSPTVGVDFGVEYQFAKDWAWNIGVKIDSSFELVRELPANETMDTGARIEQETAVSATIYTGFTYQF